MLSHYWLPSLRMGGTFTQNCVCAVGIWAKLGCKRWRVGVVEAMQLWHEDAHKGRQGGGGGNVLLLQRRARHRR